MGYIKYIILVLFLHISLFIVAQTASFPKYEYRAVWLTTIENLDWPKTRVSSPRDIDVQKKELCSLLDSLHALNVNTVLLQTRLRGDVIYPSQYEPFTDVLTGVVGKNPGYDPLAFAVEECHKRGIQLHAWLVTLPLGKVEHLRKLGRLSLRYKNPKLCRHHKGQWYMEPGEPATSEYLCNLVAEIVGNYNVDGIHLDYIRYPDRPSGYSDSQLFYRYGGGATLDDWRRANITRIVRDIYSQVKRLKPWVRVSCAPLGKHDDLTAYSSYGWNARNTVYQDAQQWVKEGIMDILFPMLYFPDNHFYPFVRDWQENIASRHLVPGVGVYRLLPSEGNWEIIEIERQLNTTRTAGALGTALFRTRHLLDNIKGASDSYKKIYKWPALVPPMSWVAEPAPPMVQGFYGSRVGDTLRLSWQKVAVQGMPAVKYNVYASQTAPVDISNVQNLMAHSLPDASFEWVGSTLNTMHWAVVPVNAYGVEGAPAFWSEKGAEQQFYREEIHLPAAQAWDARVVLRGVEGAKLYEGPYSTRVGVRGIPPGVYMLEVVNSKGVVLKRIPFTK